MTMTLVSTVTVGSGGSASIDFTGIPGSATDLFIVISARSTGSDVQVRFNGSSASNYNVICLYGSGASAATFASSSQTSLAVSFATNPSSYTANTFSNASIYIANYAGSTAKSLSADAVTENNASGSYAALTAGVWTLTDAITSITMYANSGTFAQYSTASLYTITKGSGGATTTP